MNVSLLNYTIHTYHSGTRFHCINPRSREGSDMAKVFLSAGHGDFNPRSREGSDSKIAHIRNIFSGNYVNLVKICK